jgi:hypothetical protein
VTQASRVVPGDGTTLLRLWQHGLAYRGSARADALLQEWRDEPAGARTLGERNIRLLELHARLFGPEFELLSQCPSCGAGAQFSGDCGALGAHASSGAAAAHRLEIDRYAIDFRLPDGQDLAEASRSETENDFVAALLERCVLACVRDGERAAVRDLPEPILDALSREIETLDPAARLSFAVQCPQCSTAWNADLDVGQMVWTKVQAAAERLLLDIDALARTYGWTESDVLALDPVRRAAYLQLAAG